MGDRRRLETDDVADTASDDGEGSTDGEGDQARARHA